MLPFLIILQWLCIIASVTIDLAFEANVYPKDLSDFLNKPENEPSLIFSFVMMPALILYIAGSIGLLKKRKWAFYIYTIAHLLCLLSIPIIGYNISSGFGGLFGELAMMLIGATIMAAYISIFQSGLTSRCTGECHG